MTRVTRADIMFGLTRLLEVYPRPRHMPEDPGKLAELYHRELDDLEVEAWRAAFSAYLKTDAEYLPRPGVLRVLAGKVYHPDGDQGSSMAAQRRWESDWPDARGEPLPCPTCGAVDGWSAGAPIRTYRRDVPHDAAKHAAAGIPFAGHSAEELAAQDAARDARAAAQTPAPAVAHG